MQEFLGMRTQHAERVTTPGRHLMSSPGRIDQQRVAVAFENHRGAKDSLILGPVARRFVRDVNCFAERRLVEETRAAKHPAKCKFGCFREAVRVIAPVSNPKESLSRWPDLPSFLCSRPIVNQSVVSLDLDERVHHRLTG